MPVVTSAEFPDVMKSIRVMNVPGYTDVDGVYHPPVTGPAVIREGECLVQTSGEGRARNAQGMPWERIEGMVLVPPDDETLLDHLPEDDVEVTLGRFKRSFSGKVRFVDTDSWALKIQFT
jgi:hypothetical protein